MQHLDETAAGPVRLGEVVVGLSHALDLAEGQPAGHAARACMIGMRIAREIYLLPRQRASLFYALLLKDLGCTANAAKFCGWLGGDERAAKHDLRISNWRGVCGKIGYLLRNAQPEGSFAARVARFMRVARAGAARARELVEMRSDWGAAIAERLDMPWDTVAAIRHADEHWDGLGQPLGLAEDEIPMLARIIALAQAAEIDYRRDGLDGVMAMSRSRSGTLFDPQLVKAFLAARGDFGFWEQLHVGDVRQTVLQFEPEIPGEGFWWADEDAIDQLAEGFGRVVDAKSAWSARHSVGVAEVAVGIAEAMGIDGRELRLLRRAGLLHDLGKLGISNLILDKPAKLDAAEAAEMRRHAYLTRRILSETPGFVEIAEVAGAHHERMDGGGYDRGIPAGELPLSARILSVADMFEALAARRPYRQDLTGDQVMQILETSAGHAIDETCVDGLKAFLETSQYEVSPVAA